MCLCLSRSVLSVWCNVSNPDSCPTPRLLQLHCHGTVSNALLITSTGWFSSHIVIALCIRPAAPNCGYGLPILLVAGNQALVRAPCRVCASRRSTPAHVCSSCALGAPALPGNAITSATNDRDASAPNLVRRHCRYATANFIKARTSFFYCTYIQYV